MLTWHNINHFCLVSDHCFDVRQELLAVGARLRVTNNNWCMILI